MQAYIGTSAKNLQIAFIGRCGSIMLAQNPRKVPPNGLSGLREIPKPASQLRPLRRTSRGKHRTGRMTVPIDEEVVLVEHDLERARATGRCAQSSDLQSDGGGGNRTRVRGRSVQNVYKRSPRFDFDRRPGADALPTA